MNPRGEAETGDREVGLGRKPTAVAALLPQDNAMGYHALCLKTNGQTTGGTGYPLRLALILQPGMSER